MSVEAPNILGMQQLQDAQNQDFFNYEVIVVGGGHAGVEAALISAKLGRKTLLLTHNLDTVGQMSCNPAIGGIGKGHLVKELDALGGYMGIAADHSAIQLRTLNASKGPAVQATRAQIDRSLYKQAIQAKVFNTPNLQVFQQACDRLLVERNKIVGVETNGRLKFYAKYTIITAGTFLLGRIFIGDVDYSAGRAGDQAAVSLGESLRGLPFRVGRLKTGTPPRLHKASIDFTKLEQQYGDQPLPKFSIWHQEQEIKRPQQICCYITHTNLDTHKIIAGNLHLSAMYNGKIKDGIGPRYCPSIEDKIVKFASKNSHQIFLEPEGLTSPEIYPNGLSTSLPFEVQLAYIRSIKGLEQAQIVRPGYAIEYDFFDPRDLEPTLKSKLIDGLFLAGQINGTTGYEEAAVQGLIAGINAARLAADLPTWHPKRHEGYIGVLLDDLTSQGATEPYRMFTSRSEYRLQLREDNAYLRFGSIAKDLGLLSAQQAAVLQQKKMQLEELRQILANTSVQPEQELAQELTALTGIEISKHYHLVDLIKRPELTLEHLLASKHIFAESGASRELMTIAVSEIKYDGYIKKQVRELQQTEKQAKLQIPAEFDYAKVSGLSKELLEKLNKHQPTTLGQAALIAGMTPAALNLLLVYIKKYNYSKAS